MMTTSWVLSGQCANFPLLYHWRTIPRPAPEQLTSHQEAEIERQFSAWGNVESIRQRFVAREVASASIALFLEWFPYDLHSWLGKQVSNGREPLHAAAQMVERALLDVTSFMNTQGLVHFDAHFENILTDGQRLYVSDFGQAMSHRFSLTPLENEFLVQHGDFDRSYVMTMLANALRDAPGGEEIVSRYSRIASVMKEFFRRLRHETKTAPYPVTELRRAWVETSLQS
jgi:hypothetical protein